jgi:hypothetical protein
MTTTPDLWRTPFLDNTSLTGSQNSGVVAPTNADQFFAVWVDRDNFNGGFDSIIARKFDDRGNPITGEVNLTSGFEQNLDEPAAVRLPIANQADGLAVAFTREFSATDDDIFLRRFDSTLGFLGVTIIDISGAKANHPSITSFSDGNVWVAYTFQNSATDWDIRAQHVDAAGNLVGGPITLADFGNNRLDPSDLATLANGNFVFVFTREFNNNPADHDVFFGIRTEAGAVVPVNGFSTTPVNGANNTPGNEVTPHVAALADGGFVVTWTDSLGSANGTGVGIRAAVYDATGGLVQGNILVNFFDPTGDALLPPNDVTGLPDGGFIVAWEHFNDPVISVDRAQRFDEAGNLVGTPIVWSDHATIEINAATYSDGRVILTNFDNLAAPNVVSSIWDSRITDANQTTGHNFFGPAGSPGDLFLIRDQGGVRQLEAIQTNGTATVFGTVGTNQNFVGSGDFNGNGISDLLINVDDPATGNRGFFVDEIMIPAAGLVQHGIAVRGANWIVDGIGDFNHDGTSDILEHRDIGALRFLEVSVINNFVVQANIQVNVNGTNWQVDDIGDFNGDGTADILQHQINLTGANAGSMTLRALLMSPNALLVQSSPTLGTIGANIQVDGTGDFNHDGTSDILVHQDSSATGVRTFQVLTIRDNAVVAGTTIAVTGTNISVGGIGDFNGDGTSDFLMHQDLPSNRTDIVYNVVNNIAVSTQTVAVTGIDWHVA